MSFDEMHDLKMSFRRNPRPQDDFRRNPRSQHEFSTKSSISTWVSTKSSISTWDVFFTGDFAQCVFINIFLLIYDYVYIHIKMVHWCKCTLANATNSTPEYVFVGVFLFACFCQRIAKICNFKRTWYWAFTLFSLQNTCTVFGFARASAIRKGGGHTIQRRHAWGVAAAVSLSHAGHQDAFLVVVTDYTP